MRRGASSVDGRFQTLSRLFDEIVELPIDGREAAILASCGEDQALESELRALIAADGRSGVHELLSEMVSAHAGALRKERALRPVEPRRRP